MCIVVVQGDCIIIHRVCKTVLFHPSTGLLITYSIYTHCGQPLDCKAKTDKICVLYKVFKVFSILNCCFISKPLLATPSNFLYIPGYSVTK